MKLAAMNIYKSRVAVLLMVFSLLSGVLMPWGVPAVQAETVTEIHGNLLQNGDFETGNLDAWQSSDPSKASVTTTVYHSGINALMLKGDNAYPYVRQMPVGVVPGKNYRLSFYAKGGDAATSIEYRAASADDSNTVLQALTKTGISGEWTRYELNFSSGGYAEVRIVLKATGSVFFDDIQLNAVGEEAMTEPNVHPSDANIKYFGRWNTSNPEVYTASWSGAYFKVNFTGTSAKVVLEGTVNLYISVDGTETYYEAATGTVNVTPALLANGTHSLRVTVPYTDQQLNFKGLILDEGAATAAASTGSKLIEFTGGSIVAGYLLPKLALSDYTWLAAEQLGYEHTQIAYSGMNLVDNWSGGSYISSKAGLSKQYFKLQDADTAESADWDFSRYSPDMIVINVGTNDSHFQVPGETYQSVYTEFLKELRNKNPGAEIYAQRLFNGAYAAETLQAVNARITDGDTKVHYIDTTGWITDGDTIDGTHPTETAHLKLADRLAAILGRDDLVSAANVTVQGTGKPGETLLGTYDYVNGYGTEEGRSRYRWLLSDQIDGMYSAIDGALGKALVLTRAQSKAYVKFEVTPVDAQGRSGAAAVSSPIEVAGSEAADSVFTDFISVQGDQLYEGDKLFRFASLNYPGGMRDPEFSQNDALRTIAAMGGKVTRTYIPPVKRYDNANASYALIQGLDSEGQMTFNEAGFRKLDLLLALANQYGVRLIIPFVDQWQWEGGIESYVNFRYPGTISGDAANDPDAWKFYTDPLIISDFKQVIHYMMNRVNTITGVPYKDDKAILAWETGNELGGYNQDKFPQSWTTEIAQFIREVERPSQLLLDGRFAVNEASLHDANIDIVGNHFYTGNFIDKVKADRAQSKGKKPYILGEFGLYTNPESVDALYNEALKNGTSGVMIWSLRPHKDTGGFFWHDENPGNWASYHWPGFSSGDYYGEAGIIRTVYQYAHYMDKNDVDRANTVPAIPAPDNAPLLFPVTSVADIRWQGSVGASGYEIQRSTDGVNWITLADNFSDGGRAGTPAFHDERAITGQGYIYRVRGVNESGASDWSNSVAVLSAQHIITDELSLLYNDKEKRKVYAYDHSTNLQTSSADGNELGIGYKATIPAAASGYLTYASPVPLKEIQITASGTGTVKWYISATDSGYTQILPVKNGNIFTAMHLPENTRYIRFGIPGGGSVQIDNVTLKYDYDGSGYQAVPPLQRNGFVIDKSFDLTDTVRSSNLLLVQGDENSENLATLRRSDGNAAELIYQTHGDINSYRFTSYAIGSEAMQFYTSVDGETYTPAAPVVSKSTIAGDWSKVIYTDFAVPAAVRYLKAVYPAGGNGRSPGLSLVEIGYGERAIPLTDKPPVNVLEDGEYDFGLNDNIQARYTRNPNGDEIGIALDTVNRNHGTYGVKINYALGSAYYAGISRSLKGANLASFDALHAWIKPDGSANQLSFQFTATDGHVWEANTMLNGTSGRTIELKLSSFVQPQWNIDAVGAQSINLSSVNTFAVLVSSGAASTSGSGVLYLDDVRLANAAKLDNFEGYGGYNALVQKAFVRNTGGGAFEVSLDGSHISEGANSLKIDYNFSGPGYAGGSFNPDYLNLQGYDGFSFWVQPDGSGNELAIQFTDASGKYWETKTVLKGTEPRMLHVPFDSFRYPSWYSTDTAARPDPANNIVSFSFYLGASAGSSASAGTLYIDDIQGALFMDRLKTGAVEITNEEYEVASLPLTIHGTASNSEYVAIRSGKETWYAPVREDGTWSYSTSKIGNGAREITASIDLYDNTPLHKDSLNIEVHVPNNPYGDGETPVQHNYVTNPGFDVPIDTAVWPILPLGWIHTAADGSVVTDGTVKLETSDVRSGTYRLVHWNAGAFDVTSAQHITGLPAGLYELRAWTKSKGGQQAAEMIAGTGETILKTNLPAGESSWSYIRIPNIEVRGGELTAGFHSKDLGGNWIAVEDVELVLTEAYPVEPEPTDKPEATPTPAATEEPAATATPEPDEETQPTSTAESTAQPSAMPTPSPAPVAQSASAPLASAVPGQVEPGPKAYSLTEIMQRLAESGTGSSANPSSIILQGSARGVSIPAEALDALGSRSLVVNTGGAVIQIPSALLLALRDLLPADQRQSGILALDVTVEAGERVMSAQAGVTMKQAGNRYSLQLTAAGVNGDLRIAEHFKQPVTLQLPFNAEFNPDLLGVYSLNEQGAAEYAGGLITGDHITAQVHHFSTYAVLEYDKSFSDVPAGYWAYDAIRSLAARHVVNGSSMSEFAPQAQVTRAGFTAMLARAFGWSEEAGNSGFKDVQSDAWYASSVTAASKLGIIQGDGSSQFHPQDRLTREEMAIILLRAVEQQHGRLSFDGAGTVKFKDDTAISAWARDAIAALASQGLLHGTGAGEFKPQASATRAESAQIIYALLKYKS